MCIRTTRRNYFQVVLLSGVKVSCLPMTDLRARISEAHLVRIDALVSSVLTALQKKLDRA